MKIRVGIEGGRRPVLERARLLGAPLLVSANSLWNDKRKRFGAWRCYAGHDVALDSGGFVAMARYGGYRWTADQYASLAAELKPSWWAQMDFCCEPEIADLRSKVFARIDQTVEHLHTCQRIAGGLGIPAPMPVLQGWIPSDYCQGPIFDPSFVWPALVGIGSVCRRQVDGPAGILAVVSALDRKVPAGVKFHLFGVKSASLCRLLSNYDHRIGSIDSMAWSTRARRIAFETGQACNGELRADTMAAWYVRQQAVAAAPRQQTFNL